MKYKFLITATLFFFCNLVQTSAQGCSDAGFCTIGSFKPLTIDSAATPDKNKIEIGLTTGKADREISIFSAQAEYTRQITEKFGAGVKLTFLSQSGNGISTSGLSDVYLTLQWAASEKIKLTAGLKAPLNDANKKKDNLSLPLDYQSSLGTLDILAGVSYRQKQWLVVMALQQPVSQNKNEFTPSDFPAPSQLSSFQSTNEYERSGDVLLRVAYAIRLNEKWQLTPSLLPIYHLKNDLFTDTMGIQREIDGSQGLTFNGNLFLKYTLNNASYLTLNMGAPFVTRDARPDGLTRKYVIGLDYGINF